MKKILLQISGLIAFIIVFTGYNLNGSAKDKIRSIDVKQDQIVNILYESMRAGELEPCGCPKRPIGGLSKLTTFYQDLKEKNPNTWYINGGGALYPAVFNDETHKKQAFFKVPYISRILNLTNLDLYYYQPFDYLINMDANEKALSIFNKKLIKKNNQWKVLKTKSNLKIAIFNVIDPEESSFAKPIKTQVNQFESNQPHSELVALVFYGYFERLKVLLPNFKNVDFVLLSKERRVFFSANTELGVPVFNAGYKGRYISHFTIHLKKGEKKLPLIKKSEKTTQNIEFTYKAVALSPKFKENSKIQDEINKFKLAQEKFLASILSSKKNKKEESSYMGSISCKNCHFKIHKNWKNSKHAHAFDTLVNKTQQNNPECISCHSIGFKEPEGFSTLPVPEKLKHVGCESCHGNANKHVLLKEKMPKINSKTICLKCHTKENSPDFNYKNYSKKPVLHW